jgi:hypothetical protein
LKNNTWKFAFAFMALSFVLTAGIATAYAAAPTPEPTLKLVKSVTTDDGGTAVADDWELFATAEDGSNLIYNLGGSGVSQIVPAGTTITLSESGPDGYGDEIWSCTGGDFAAPNKIILTEGDKATCTSTSDDVAPSITLVNKVQNDNGATATADQWTLTATAPKSDSARNISGTGTPNADGTEASISSPVFANVSYVLGAEGPSGYTALNDGRWACTIKFPNGFAFSVAKASSLNLKEGDSAVCSITHDDDVPSFSVTEPTKSKGKYTVTAELTGFSSAQVGFTVNNPNSLEATASTETIVYDDPYSYSIPAKDLEAGATYFITVTVYDGSDALMTETVELVVPAKGNTK